MLKNFLLTSFRNLLNKKAYSLITILGLAVGMAGTLLILMYVQDDLSYDTYHVKADNIYRLTMFFRFGGREGSVAVVAPPAAAAMIRDFPEVADAARFRDRGSYILQHEDQSYRETRIIFADNSFFNIFSIPLLKGDPKTALVQPKTLVMNRKTAEKYFGKEDPIGKTVKLDNQNDYMVTGIFKEIPDNSHFHFDILLSMPSIEESRDVSWLSQNFQTYVLLRENADPEALEAKLTGFTMKYMGPQIEKILGQSIENLDATDFRLEMSMQPLRDIHLRSDLDAELEPNSDIKYVYIFSTVALFILLIASINFVNLTTARASGRAREVGIRKVLGSYRGDLIRRFLAESVMLSIISVVFALGLVMLAMNFFNRLSGKNLGPDDLFSFPMMGAVAAVTFFVGVIAGAYPAFVLASFRPAETLRGRLKTGAASGPLRSALVVFQFTASVILIISTTVVARQLHFIQHKKLGYEKEQVIILDNAYLLKDQAEALKEEVLKYPEFSRGTISGYLPVPSNRNNTTVFPEGNFNDPATTSLQVWRVDYDFIPTFGMKIAKGRDFSREFGTDEEAAVVNQSLVKQFGYDDALGKRLSRFISNDGEIETYRIIGVVEDFHFDSLRNSIQPLLMHVARSTESISFRFNTDNVSSVISKLRETWHRFLPQHPFEYSFLDERFFNVYAAEQRIGQIFGVFAVMAVFIGCLGLFALVSFIAEKRTKEIGIRKVLGSSIAGIIRILLKEFAVLVAAANLIAWPIAYWIMHDWLQDFAYKAALSWWIFIMAGLISIVVAMATVSVKAVRTALTDPVKSLRYE